MTTRRNLACFLTVFCTLLVIPAASSAQPRGSERGTVNQIINGTSITFDFGRPVARGRDNLFGGVVHWGEMWTPGANWATTIEVDKEIELNGHAVPAGKYSVWMQPQPDTWTVFLNREWRLYHDTPVPGDQQLFSFTVEPQEGGHMEALAWYFPVVGPSMVEARVHWGTTYVALTIEAPLFVARTLPVAERMAFIGRYQLVGNDPTTGGPLTVPLEINTEGDQLVGRWGRGRVELIPTESGELMIGFIRNGQLFDVAPEMTLRMIEGDSEGGIELLWEGERSAKGDRVP
jgi:hypothetical protein